MSAASACIWLATKPAAVLTCNCPGSCMAGPVEQRPGQRQADGTRCLPGRQALLLHIVEDGLPPGVWPAAWRSSRRCRPVAASGIPSVSARASLARVKSTTLSLGFQRGLAKTAGWHAATDDATSEHDRRRHAENPCAHDPPPNPLRHVTATSVTGSPAPGAVPDSVWEYCASSRFGDNSAGRLSSST